MSAASTFAYAYDAARTSAPSVDHETESLESAASRSGRFAMPRPVVLQYDVPVPLRVSRTSMATKPAAEVDDVLGSLPKGDSKGDRVRVAGSDAELGEKWDDLTRGGTPGEWKNYDGEVIDPSLTLIVRGGVGGGGGGGGGRVRGKALLGWDHFSF